MKDIFNINYYLIFQYFKRNLHFDNDYSFFLTVQDEVEVQKLIDFITSNVFKGLKIEFDSFYQDLFSFNKASIYQLAYLKGFRCKYDFNRFISEIKTIDFSKYLIFEIDWYNKEVNYEINEDEIEVYY